MTTSIQAMIPVEEFALAETLQTCADATVECERCVALPAETVMPLVWVRTTPPDAFEAALAQDPTVETYTQLAATPTECLYEIQWAASVELILQFITMEGAVILDAGGTAAGWDMRLLVPDRDAVRMIHDFCKTHNLTLTIRTIQQLDDEPEAIHHGTLRAGLTPEQHEALTVAYKRGYFRVPRAIDLETVATEIGVSHQALSERLRRGHHTLIGEMLGGGTDPPLADQHPAVDGDQSAADTAKAEE